MVLVRQTGSAGSSLPSMLAYVMGTPISHELAHFIIFCLGKYSLFFFVYPFTLCIPFCLFRNKIIGDFLTFLSVPIHRLT